ncbi:hypothetical protein OQA88_7636 [Cercophora sp. LCS_1]
MHLLLVTALLGTASAKQISDKKMQKLVEIPKGWEIAMASQPMWFFTQAMGHPTCYPTYAEDLYTREQRHPAKLCEYPDTSCHCRQPGVEPGYKGPGFPVYYSTKRCGESEIRVAYNLFYQKDGFAPGEENGGHPYDWERVIAVWNKYGNNWSPSKLLLSQHDTYESVPWHDIPSTVSGREAKKHLGGKNGQKGKDHPKVYVGWSKHSHYVEPYQGLQTPLVQMTPWATRGYDWWYFPTKEDYHLTDGKGSQKKMRDLGKQFNFWNWGPELKGQDPMSVHLSLCNVTVGKTEKAFVPLRLQKLDLQAFLNGSLVLKNTGTLRLEDLEPETLLRRL